MDGRLIGIGRFTIRVPGWVIGDSWFPGVCVVHSPIAFMTPEHHRVRDFVVLELPAPGEGARAR